MLEKQRIGSYVTDPSALDLDVKAWNTSPPSGCIETGIRHLDVEPLLLYIHDLTQ